MGSLFWAAVFWGKGGKVAQFFQEISIFSRLGSHMSCRGYFPHSGSFLSYRECVLWCSGVPLPPLTLVFCLLFPTLLPALLLPFCLSSGFSPFLNASTEVPQTNLAQLWPTMDLFWSFGLQCVCIGASWKGLCQAQESSWPLPTVASPEADLCLPKPSHMAVKYPIEPFTFSSASAFDLSQF